MLLLADGLCTVLLLTDGLCTVLLLADGLCTVLLSAVGLCTVLLLAGLVTMLTNSKKHLSTKWTGNDLIFQKRREK